MEKKKTLVEIYKEADETGEVDIGDRVFCDSCGEEWTGRPESGGFLFGSKAICPNCAPEMMKKIIHYCEQEYIHEVCPKEMSYWKWCVSLRGGNNKIKIIKS